MTFATSCGTFTVTLDLDAAPETSASLVALAEDGFYDDTIFHRIIPGFVIQGGDPTQTGGGGPGYSTVDVPPADAAYVKGVVAMAKSAAEAPGTSGSQFFVVTGADVGLPPEYAVVGEVTEGLDVVELIGTLGDPATEQPIQPIVVESVTPHRRDRVAAVVLAAGAATRSAPKQRLLLPRVLERLRPPSTSRRRRGRVRTRTDQRRAITPGTCAEWERGPGASLPAGSPRSATASGRRSYLADGPWLAPDAIARVVEGWRATGATSSPHRTAGSGAPAGRRPRRLG